MTDWTPKQHLEHQEMLKRMERERLGSKVVPEPIPRKKKTKRKNPLGDPKK